MRLRRLILALPLVACVLTGCTVCVYQRGSTGRVSFVAVSVLENGALSKLSVDRMIRTNRWGLSIGQLNQQVDDTGIEAAAKGAVEGLK